MVSQIGTSLNIRTCILLAYIRDFFLVLLISGRGRPALIATYDRAIINVEIFDAFGGRSTTAQEVSKSTEVRYTTLQLRAATGQEPGPARQNIIGEFDERSLVNYYTGSLTAQARSFMCARTVRTEKRKLRIPEEHQQRSWSPGRFSFSFLFFLSSFSTLSLSLFPS